jgi:hypothetical protein
MFSPPFLTSSPPICPFHHTPLYSHHTPLHSHHTVMFAQVRNLVTLAWAGTQHIKIKYLVMYCAKYLFLNHNCWHTLCPCDLHGSSVTEPPAGTSERAPDFDATLAFSLKFIRVRFPTWQRNFSTGSQLCSRWPGSRPGVTESDSDSEAAESTTTGTELPGIIIISDILLSSDNEHFGDSSTPAVAAKLTVDSMMPVCGVSLRTSLRFGPP